MTETTPLPFATDQLDAEKRIDADRLPELSDIRAIATKGQAGQCEYGVGVYDLINGKGAVYVKGYETEKGIKAIRIPTFPCHLRDQVKSGVFIHTHPLKNESLLETPDVPTGVLPSRSGDFPESSHKNALGTYLNVATVFGLVMNVGAAGMDRSEYVTRTLRGRLGVPKQAFEDVWKVWTGKRAGDTLENIKGGKVDSNPLLGSQDVIIISHTCFSGTVSWFLFISWDKLEELERVHGGLENLCFGDGVEKLVKELSVNIPHGKNLGEVSKKAFVSPLKRNEEAARPKSSKVKK